jgi:hypothetical protein
MRLGFVLLPISLSVGLLRAQQAPVNGALEGFTFDAPTRSIRPVIGSVGSASLGQPLIGSSFASVAPHQNYALSFQGDRCILVTGLGSGQISMAEVPGSFPRPEGLSWSTDGTMAVLYSRTGNSIQILSGIPAAVTANPSISVSALGGSLSSVATDVHGTRVVIGILGDVSGVYQSTNGGPFSPVLPGIKPVSVAITNDGGTLYVLDGGAGQVVQQNLADLSSQSWPLDGVADPIALLPGRDAAGRTVVYVAGRGDRLLQVFDASTHGVAASVPLSFSPHRLEPLGSNSFLFDSRLTGDDILWSFTNASQPALYFVPAVPVEIRRDRDVRRNPE